MLTKRCLSESSLRSRSLRARKSQMLSGLKPVDTDWLAFNCYISKAAFTAQFNFISFSSWRCPHVFSKSWANVLGSAPSECCVNGACSNTQHRQCGTRIQRVCSLTSYLRIQCLLPLCWLTDCWTKCHIMCRYITNHLIMCSSTTQTSHGEIYEIWMPPLALPTGVRIYGFAACKKNVSLGQLKLFAAFRRTLPWQQYQ